MVKKKKYPPIVPQFLKDKKGNNVEVYLEYQVYESIFEEMADLKKRIAELKKKKTLKK